MPRSIQYGISVFLLLTAFLRCTPRHGSGTGSQSGSNMPKPVPAITTATDSFLASLMGRQPLVFGEITDNPEEFRVQLIYTRIDRDAQNRPVFTDHYYNVDPKRYFYPASTVKMPIAFLALQRLNELNRPGLDKHTALITQTDPAAPWQTPVFNDPTTPDGQPTIAQYIKKIFLVSDNDAYNRLYEFLGQEYVNTTLQKMGYTDAAIIHRLSIPLSTEQNRLTNPVSFLDSSANPILSLPGQLNKRQYPRKEVKMGKGYYSGGKLVNQPFDFSAKNRLSLPDLHNILRSVIFPEATSARRRFNLKSDDYRFLYQYMSQYPGETSFPDYSGDAYWDAYVKFLLAGSEKKPIPKAIRIFNKPGDAYGFLTDVAYIVDFERGVEFMLSATIHCNRDGIYNDDHYDYKTIGFPFMKHIGQAVYEYELSRQRKHIPDLSAFKMKYDQ